MPRHRHARRRPARKHGMKRRIPRAPSIANKNQTATVIETIELNDLIPNTVYQHVFQLGQFTRASQVAANYAFYKAASCEWKYEPLYNTFQDGVGGLSKPYLYTLMNRQQETAFTNINSQNFQAIQSAGAKAVALASTKNVKYVPNWCSPGLVATTSGGEPMTLGLQKQFSWLSTPSGTTSTQAGVPSNNVAMRIISPPVQNTALGVVYNYANAVVYNGHLDYLDQKISQGGDTPPPICRITLTVVWKFKGAACRLLGLSSEAPTTA